jgi:hypothetical protein
MTADIPDGKPKAPVWLQALRMAASLKLTVALLALSIFIVLAGTLAQVDKGIWTVVRDYFRTAFAWIDLAIFFPDGWGVPKNLGFYFPGGWLIGAALVINLLAAQAVRFTVQARGRRLVAGLCVTACGVGLTALAISSAFDVESGRVQPVWRIFIQMAQGGGAGVVLLAGCILLFYRRAGTVVAHAGIILIMMNELVTGWLAVEGHMSIREGESSSVVTDSRSTELAITDSSNSKHDTVVAIDRKSVV